MPNKEHRIGVSYKFTISDEASRDELKQVASGLVGDIVNHHRARNCAGLRIDSIKLPAELYLQEDDIASDPEPDQNPDPKEIEQRAEAAERGGRSEGGGRGGNRTGG